MNTVEPDRESTKPCHPEVGAAGAFVSWRALSPQQRQHLMGCLAFTVLLAMAFVRPLISLALHAVQTDLHSYILLMPFISAYLIYIQRKQLPAEYNSSPVFAMICLTSGLMALTGGLTFQHLSHNDFLALMAFSFISFMVAGGFLFMGREWMCAAAFPVAFLLFMVPLPDCIVTWLETGLKLASADAASMFFSISGTPVLREGVVFQLPGIVIQVAQECSGIQSSWILFITGLLVSYLFLKSPWQRFVLVAVVIPLGILRNGFRILVIGLLCVHVGPHMIHSMIHHRGGPVFFALSLIPLFLLLWWLRRG